MEDITKLYTIVGFNEEGKRKFTDARDRLFIFIGAIPNNPQYVIVRGFRGRFAFGDEFIEDINDLRVLSPEEVHAHFGAI